MKTYVASSWKNKYQPDVVAALRAVGHEVYDFRHPEAGDDGFHWSEIHPAWPHWTREEYRAALSHPLADHGFGLDMNALRWSEAVVLVLPCGKSSHLELGWAIGAQRRTLILMLDDDTPELMYKAADHLCLSVEELLAQIETP